MWPCPRQPIIQYSRQTGDDKQQPRTEGKRDHVPCYEPMAGWGVGAQDKASFQPGRDSQRSASWAWHLAEDSS